MMQSVFTLYVGGQFDRHGRAIPASKSYEAITSAVRKSIAVFNGSTFLFGWSGYLNAQGEQTLEKSARIEIITAADRRAEVLEIASDLRVALDLQEILVTEIALQSVVSIHAPEVIH